MRKAYLKIESNYSSKEIIAGIKNCLTVKSVTSVKHLNREAVKKFIYKYRLEYKNLDELCDKICDLAIEPHLKSPHMKLMDDNCKFQERIKKLEEQLKEYVDFTFKSGEEYAKLIIKLNKIQEALNQ